MNAWGRRKVGSFIAKNKATAKEAAAQCEIVDFLKEAAYQVIDQLPNNDEYIKVVMWVDVSSHMADLRVSADHARFVG